jgi:hypothetical protein
MRVFVVRKALLFTILVVCTLIFSTLTLASDVYTSGCCIDPFGPTGQLLESTQETCSPPNVWLTYCYGNPTGELELNPDVFDTRGCCCFGATAGYADETSGTEYTTASVLEAYCDENEGDFQSLTANSCQAQCLGGFNDVNIKVDVTGMVETGEGEDAVGLSDVAVTLELDSGAKFETTTENGLYELFSVATGPGTFYLTTPADHPYDCETYSQSVSITTFTTEFNFNLDCQPKPGVCIPDWTIGEWGDCQLYGGTYLRTRTIADANGCGLPPPNATTEYCEGYDLTPGDCGDGALHQGEQCDTTVFRTYNQSTTTDNSCEMVFGSQIYGQGSVLCTDYCTYDVTDCEPACGTACDHISKCAGCASCEDTAEGRALCSQGCASRAPVFLAPENMYTSADRNVYSLYNSLDTEELRNTDLFPGISYTLETRDASLSWMFNSSCHGHIMGFRMEICEEHGSTNTCTDGTKQSVMVSSPTQRSGTLTGVLEKPYTSYCYNICSITTSGVANCAYDATNLPCFTSGSTTCMQPVRQEGYNCQYLQQGFHPAGCHIDEYWDPLSNLSLAVDYCNTEELCVETVEEPGAACKPIEPCQKCNGLFGLYANYNLPITMSDGTPLNCESLQYYGTKSLNQRISPSSAIPHVGQCYKDEQLTSQPAYGSCEQIDSCYAYSSKSACENDPCMKFQNDNNANTCGWTSFNDELGIGVCGPVDTDLVACGRCDTDSPLGFCTQELCQDIYGQIDEEGNSVCYYNTDALLSQPVTEEVIVKNQLFRSGVTPVFPTCQNKNNMACSFYTTKNDCIGETGQNAAFNISYSPSYAFGVDTRAGIPIAGNNAQLAFSNDYFGFGTCQWLETEGRCIKNSDSYFYHSTTGSRHDDCMESASTQFLSCLSDNEPPTTTILWREGDLPTYGIFELLTLPMDMNDNQYPSIELTTVFSIVARGEPETYPLYTLDDLGRDDATLLRELIPVEGEYVVSYFSKDIAQNMEPVQTKHILVDMSSPSIDLSIDVNANNLTPDRFVSEITVVLETNEPSHCKLSLHDSTGTHLIQPVNDKEAFNTLGLSTTYVYISDGIYRITGFCRDDYLNEVTFDEEVRVQADKTITNTYPYGQTFGLSQLNTLQFELTTANEATCAVASEQFTSVTPPERITTLDTDSEQTDHSIMYVDAETYTTSSGSYTYYVRCEFLNATGDTTVVQNVDSHALSFTIDGVPPTTQLYKKIGTNPSQLIPYTETGENWAEEKKFQIRCSDESSITPFGDVVCKLITHCLLDKRTVDQQGIVLTHANFQDYCQATAITSIGTTKDILIADTYADLQKYGQKYLYYYGEDKYGNTEPTIQRADLRIRNTAFPDPLITIV